MSDYPDRFRLSHDDLSVRPPAGDDGPDPESPTELDIPVVQAPAPDRAGASVQPPPPSPPPGYVPSPYVPYPDGPYAQQPYPQQPYPQQPYPQQPYPQQRYGVSPGYAALPPDGPPPAARGVTFRRRGEDERRSLAAPVALVVIAVLLLGGIAWLLGAAGGRDGGPVRSPSPRATVAGGLGSPSVPSATEEPTDSPSPEPTESATPEPTDSATPGPTESATPEPTELPTELPTEVPTAPPTDEPTPQLPTPEPTEAPSGFEVPPGQAVLRVDLEADAFSGGRSGTYHGRSARWVYGTRSGDDTMSAQFVVTGDPVGTARLRINGLDSEGAAKTAMRIRLNGVSIFRGANPLDDDVCCGPGGNGHWTSVAFDLPASLLHPGTNVVTISNLERTGRIGVPFVMIDSAKLLYLVPE